MRIFNNCNILKNNLITLKAALTCFLLGVTGMAAADSVFVSYKHNKIFIADGGLFIKDLDTGTANTMCSPDGIWHDPAGAPIDPALLDTATDVVVKHNYAIVTIHPLDIESGDPFVDTITVDLTGCLGHKVVTVDECIATVDLDDGFMNIPCVEYNGGYLTVKMHRRGNSDNWEVHTFGDNDNMNQYHGHHHGDDDHHDHDDDDDDDDDHH